MITAMIIFSLFGTTGLMVLFFIYLWKYADEVAKEEEREDDDE